MNEVAIIKQRNAGGSVRRLLRRTAPPLPQEGYRSLGGIDGRWRDSEAHVGLELARLDELKEVFYARSAML